MGWLLLVGVLMAGTIFALAVRGMLQAPDEDACPSCEHAFGLSPSRKHCGAQDDHNGWSSDLCRCDNDYHWNYASTAESG